MFNQVGEWLELKVWQMVVGALSSLRPLGAARTGGRVIRAASYAAQRASEHALDIQAQHALKMEYTAQDLYAEPGWNSPSTLLARLAENWATVAATGWVLGLFLGLWLAGAR